MNELAEWIGDIMEMLSLGNVDKIEREFIQYGDRKSFVVKAYRVGSNLIRIDIKY